MYWQVKLVADEELGEEFVVVSMGGDYLVIARESIVRKEPGRIMTEVMRVLTKLHCPDRPHLSVVA